MPQTTTNLFEGTPRFGDKKSAVHGPSVDAAATWHFALQGDLKAALQGVSGDFAVGVTLRDGRTFLAVE